MAIIMNNIAHVIANLSDKKVKGSTYGSPYFAPINPVLQSRTNSAGKKNNENLLSTVALKDCEIDVINKSSIVCNKHEKPSYILLLCCTAVARACSH
ncbi:hypothetical protein NBRC116591_01450 [Sessilibacter corallicola]|uniref:Uncharacterized protein n=1 Tax=Sessilibacter corallicola TaxID=2904075 RepID=A0ABQ0A455_9GAMM